MSDPVIDAIDAELKQVESTRTDLLLKSDAAAVTASSAFLAFSKVDERYQALHRARRALGGK